MHFLFKANFGHHSRKKDNKKDRKKKANREDWKEKEMIKRQNPS